MTTTLNAVISAYERGYDEALGGVPRDANNHPVGSIEAAAWGHGWDAAEIHNIMLERSDLPNAVHTAIRKLIEVDG